MVVLRRLQRDCLPAGLRPVMPASLHLTLHFLGACRAEVARALCDAAARLATGARLPLRLQVRDWVLLPEPGRPRVVAAALGSDGSLHALHAELLARVGTIGTGLATAGGDGRRFLPHVTLARVAPEIRLEPLPPCPQPWLRFAHMGLYASEPAGAGSRYRALWTSSSGQASGQT